MKATATLKAMAGEYADLSPEKMAAPEGMSQLVFVTESDSYFSTHGYTFVGMARIEVDVIEHKDIVAGKVEALQEQIKSVRAKAAAEVTQLEGRIQNLLAIGMTPADDGIPF